MVHEGLDPQPGAGDMPGLVFKHEPDHFLARRIDAFQFQRPLEYGTRHGLGEISGQDPSLHRQGTVRGKRHEQIENLLLGGGDWSL